MELECTDPAAETIERPEILRPSSVGLCLAQLFGWTGGYGLEGTGQWIASIGLEPGYLMALLAGSAGFFCGLALIVGLLVRPAAALLAFTMVIAIFAAHAGNGLFLSDNGYHFGLALFAASTSVAISGAARAPLDRLSAGAGS